MSEGPNILLIMTDQQRRDCLGIAGHPVLMTPNMDAIAGSGVRFSRAYTTCPTCIAARRSLLSGQFPETHGMVGYRDGVEWDPPATLPEVLGRAGYHTYIVGRSMHQHPRWKRYGFDHKVIKGGLSGEGDYEKWLKKQVPEGDYYGAGVMHNDWTARPWHLDERLHMTNWTVEQALEFLERRDPSCPFFLAVSFLAPHPPLVPPAFYMERYLRMDLPKPRIGQWASPPPEGGRGQDISANHVDLQGEALRSCRAGYYGLINHIDDQLRRLLSPVNGIERRTDRETIIIFTSDHGEMLGDHYLWHKKRPYEPSAGIPLLIRPADSSGIRPGTVIHEPVCLEDVMPTLLDMAGVEIPDSVEGKSLLPLMREGNPLERDYLHIEHAPIHHTLTDGREKYIWFVEDGREQYFNLDDDPGECRDLSGVHEMKDRLTYWRSELIGKLKGRPEGFSDGQHLIPGVSYPPVLPHGKK